MEGAELHPGHGSFMASLRGEGGKMKEPGFSCLLYMVLICAYYQ